MDVVTFGQYMRPTKRHMKVTRYLSPAEFDQWKKVADDMGFLYVASGPLVRSSYKVTVALLCSSESTNLMKAGELYLENILRSRRETLLLSSRRGEDAHGVSVNQ